MQIILRLRLSKRGLQAMRSDSNEVYFLYLLTYLKELPNTSNLSIVNYHNYCLQ